MKTKLPEGWKEVSFEDIAVVDSGQGAPQGEKYFDGNNIFVRAGDLNNLTDGKYVGEYCEKVTNEAITDYNLKKYPAGSVVFPKSGMSIMTDNLSILKYDSYVVNHLAIIQPNDIKDVKYIFYLLKKVKTSNLSKNSSYPSIRMSDIQKFKLIWPPREIRQKIVSILEKAEAAKEMRKEADDLTKEFLKAVFIEMFGNVVTNNKKWSSLPLGELCTIRRGASPRPIDDFIGDEVPWIKIGDGTKGNELYIEKTNVKITKKGAERSVFLKSGSLIFANCGVSLGFARILKIDGCIHDGWLSFENLDEKLNQIYLLKLINQITLYLIKLAPEGTQPNLNTGIMKNLSIPLPPISLQNKFASIVKEVESMKEQQKHSKEQIDNLFNALTQRAFKGELMV